MVQSKPQKYRWVILLIYFLLTTIIEIQWLTFASIASEAQDFYNVTSLQIDFFSIVYMAAFILMSLPASYIIDTYGLKTGLIIGAILTGSFGLLKGFFGDSYLIVAIAQTGLAIAQPFILNAVTKIGAIWFPQNERATVAGIGSLAQYLGIIIALALTPVLIKSDISESFQIKNMLVIYGIASFIISVILIILMKKPAKVEGENQVESYSVKEGIINIFRIADMKKLLVLFFIGLGIFNAVSTCIDQICHSLTMEETGIIGGVMLIGGILGALILPPLSDKFKQRKPFMVICMLLMVPGLIGLAFFTSFMGLMISGFFFGFFIMSAGPIGFQYGAERSAPTPESTSQGIILLVGQVSGILFVIGVNVWGVLISMSVFIVLSIFNVFLSTRLKESYLKK